MKKIGVLTSGGDSPGMNAAIRNIVLHGMSNNIDVYGIRYGFKGLATGDLYKLKRDDVSDIIGRGGTILYSSRYPEFKEKEVQLKAIANLKEMGIEGLITIGGDGTYRGALELARLGYPVIGLPGTIDNDLQDTDYTIGFDTAVATAVEAVDKIRDTATSHERLFVIEVMGRHAGDIAFWTGVATGVDKVIIPEVPFDFEEIASEIRAKRVEGRKRYLIVLAEGVMGGYEFSKKLSEIEDFSVRVTQLGHVQRGGSPSPRDRILAARLGSHAVEVFLNGQSGVSLGVQDNDIVMTDLEESFHQSGSFIDDYDLSPLDFII